MIQKRVDFGRGISHIEKALCDLIVAVVMEQIVLRKIKGRGNQSFFYGFWHFRFRAWLLATFVRMDCSEKKSDLHLGK